MLQHAIARPNTFYCVMMWRDLNGWFGCVCWSGKKTYIFPHLNSNPENITVQGWFNANVELWGAPWIQTYNTLHNYEKYEKKWCVRIALFSVIRPLWDKVTRYLALFCNFSILTPWPLPDCLRPLGEHGEHVKAIAYGCQEQGCALCQGAIHLIKLWGPNSVFFFNGIIHGWNWIGSVGSPVEHEDSSNRWLAENYTWSSLYNMLWQSDVSY